MKQKESSKEPKKGEVLIYEDRKGHTKLEVNFQGETAWLSQKQIASLFDIDRTVITKHIKNIFKEKELNRSSVCAFFAHTAEDGKIYNVEFYNLDAILSIGYRVNSKRATQFRIWATQTLRKYLIDGYVVNQKQLQEKREHDLKELEGAINLLKGAMQYNKLNQGEAEGLLTVITEYANSWVLLQKYDEGKLEIQKKKVKKVAALSY